MDRESIKMGVTREHISDLMVTSRGRATKKPASKKENLDHCCGNTCAR